MLVATRISVLNMHRYIFKISTLSAIPTEEHKYISIPYNGNCIEIIYPRKIYETFAIFNQPHIIFHLSFQV